MDLISLSKSGTIKHVPAGEILLYQNEAGEHMYIILQGSIEILLHTLEEFPRLLATLKTGDFFGEMSLLEGEPRSATARAAEETVLLEISRDHFLSMVTQEPSLSIRIMKTLSRRIRQQNATIVQLHQEIKVLEQSLPLQENSSEDVPAKKIESPLSSRLTEQQSSDTPEPVLTIDELKVFPPDHKLYSKKINQNQTQYLRAKEVQCPVCQVIREEQVIRYSKLNLIHIDEEFRHHYKDFEPLWYTIWLCTSCYYANFYHDFFKTPNSKQKEQILQRAPALKRDAPLYPGTSRDINQVFLSYYMAIKTHLTPKPQPLQLGKLWMRLNWLYGDVDDKTMKRISQQQALAYFYQGYFQGAATSMEEDQQLAYILAYLFQLQENYGMARKLYHGILRHSFDHQKIKDKARDQLLIIKEQCEE